MKPIATMTLIRGKGECQAIMNNVVMEEMARMNRRHKYEMDTMSGELAAARIHRNKLLAKELEDLRVRLAKPTSLWERFKEKVEIAWCVFFGTLIELGLIEYVGDSKTDI